MIFLVRHGEAAAGWGDHADPGLSELGHQQAIAASLALKALGATNIVSSPMQRCRETAEPLARLIGKSPAIVPEVSEISTPPGIADRVAWLRDVMRGTWDDAGPDYTRWRLDMAARVAGLPDDTAVFSHFVAINALVGLIEGKQGVTIFRPAHCSITRLGREGGRLQVDEYGSETATRVL